jgi:CheY-like chemotaxis protein
LARKILLADDSVTAQNMGRRILSDAGYEVITVNNGSAALKKIAESKPDLIILDVYMPGYGGLEVCQRLKEAPETARIPVLLSVGKLEPFKVDEARRVRADGHIIKPFEASELLTALTKLEDKIVPQAESFKPGRFAKATASAEQLSTASQSVGEDSGWKSRLTIPTGTPKPEEAEVQVPEPASAGLRDAAKREESKSVAMKSAEVAAALPPGITAEELAAIAAAANALAGNREPGGSNSKEADATSAAKIESQVQVKAESSTAEIAEAATLASAPAVPHEARNEERKDVQTASQAAELRRATTDAEVLAALASLSPSHIEALAPEHESASPARDHSAEHQGKNRATGETGATGPRWIAQSVAIADDESTLILEREMEKAYAAMASLEEEKTAVAATAPADLSSRVEAATGNESALPAPETSPLSVSPAAAESSQPWPAAEPASSPEAQVEVVAGSDPQADAPEVAAVVSPVPTENPIAVSQTSIPVSDESAAYAAAASAGSGVPEPIENSALAPAQSVASGAADPGRESELAAAWQNWKQIRESILGSQRPKDGTPTTATAGIDEIREEESTVGLPEVEASSEAAPSDSATIANIVDSVLAELKPKLMEEITKKMKKDKKK